jgi:hypothetical protein
MFDRDILKPQGFPDELSQNSGINPGCSDRLYNEPGPDAPRTGPHVSDTAVLADVPYLLQIRIPDSLGLVICMADVVTDMRRLAAEFTYSAHDSSFLSGIYRAGAALIDRSKDACLSECVSNNKDNLSRTHREGVMTGVRDQAIPCLICAPLLPIFYLPTTITASAPGSLGTMSPMI